MSLESNVEPRPSIFDRRKRGCTDWPCLLIFVLLLILYILFAIFVFREGSLRRFIYPTDTQGRICGTDSQIHRDYLQFFDIIKCIKYILIGARCSTPQICVEQCPSKFYHYKLLYAQELKLPIINKNKIKQIRAQLSCEKSAESQVENPNISIYSLVKERKVCAPYSFPSINFYGRCLPSIIVHALNLTIQQADDIIKNRGGNTTDDDIIPDKISMQNSLEYFKKALQIKRVLSYMFEDLIESRYVLLLSLLFAMIILLIYMFLLRYLAQWIIWLSLILCIIVFALAASFCFVARIRMEKYSTNNNALFDLDEMNITLNINNFDINNTDTKISAVEKFDTAMNLLDEFVPMSVIWLIIGIICCVVCAILMICTCCLCERIRLAAALIEEASKAICYALTILIWPIITFILNIGFVILGILVLAHYSTLGRPIYQISCTQDFGQSCRKESLRSYVLSNETRQINIHSIPKSCLDYHEGDSCNLDEFTQLNCTIDRIQCVYVSYGFVDETFQHYLNSIWSHRFAQFLSEHSWLVNIFNIFMIYWLLAFTIALEQMILACTFVSYYWQLNQLNQKCCHNYIHKCLCFQGVLLTFRYHLGTIAFGSSIIAIIDTLRTLIDLIKDRMEAMNIDNYGKCCLKIIKGSLNCIRCCFQFFSRYTYIMTAVSGKWFCSSAFTATKLLLENCLRVFILDRVCAILLYIGRITITIGSCVFTAYILDNIGLNITLHFSWFPVLIIGISVYISSAIFLNVYATATSTLFFCVIYDLEVRNDSQQISNRLREIIDKSNDFRKIKFEIIDEQSTNDRTQSRF
ncbi:unnamed protein product [Adineta steineri]|uniref:Choline transporter-like protein n=1 Tax=Adineta steineri TaxID=433720 RepID=A0A814RME2_9BILA|nr:unnamed protein product [Adineta steineri]